MDIVQPPVLLARIMTFVFAAALVTIIVLIVTLAGLAPLEKSQVFFMTTSPRDNVEISINSYTPNSKNIEIYKENFIKEYIKARNEVYPNIAVMRQKWGTDDAGTVNMLSSPDVYAGFQKTELWTALMNDVPDFVLRCPVEFKNIAARAADTYAVNFSWFCTNNDGQTTKKDYTIVLRIEFVPRQEWSNRLENPLGIRVVEYNVESGGGDPLNWLGNL